MVTLRNYTRLLLFLWVAWGCEHKNPSTPNLDDAEELIFGSSLESFSSVYRLNVLSGKKTRLSIFGQAPLVAPDGEQLAYYTEYQPHPQVSAIALFVSRLDGSNVRRIAHIAGLDTLVFAVCDWSPDSKKIAYSSPREGGGHQIYVYDLEKSYDDQLTFGGHAWGPQFSPLGTKISYPAVLPGDSFGYYVMNSDGSDQHLFMGQKLTSEPHWSPDEQIIVFSIKREPSLTLNSDIFLCDAQESNRIQLTFDGKSTAIAWSPNGQEILFLSERDGSRDLYIMDKDGKNQRRITTGMNANVFARWSPQGQMIVFGVDEPRDGEIPLYLWRSGQSPKFLQVWVGGKFSWLRKQ
jgi:Tol biopolymer transport system component